MNGQEIGKSYENKNAHDWEQFEVPLEFVEYVIRKQFSLDNC